METYQKDNDRTVFCISAKSFPDGIMEAYQKLHSIFPLEPGRDYYGISYMDHGKTVYKAAVGLKDPKEAGDIKLETFIIRKGKYTGKVIENYMDDIPAIGRTFQVLLDNPNIDPRGYCLEEYFNEKDVRCLVKLKDD